MTRKHPARLFATALLLASIIFQNCATKIPAVYPHMETQPVASLDDAADDPCIFIHPTDPDKNAIIGTDKQFGLIVYDTKGKAIHEYAFGRINNVDIRQNVQWNSETITVVGGSNRSSNSVSFYQLNESTLALTPLHDEPIPSKVDEVYGFCLYQSDDLYAFVVGKDGIVEQWVLTPGEGNKLQAKMVRSFDVGTQCEGMVADDFHHILYVAEEDVGIWRFEAEPDKGDTRTKVQLISENKALKADIEGLTIYQKPGGEGYLIASSQGNNSYAVYTRTGGNKYLGSFRIKKGSNGMEGTYDTDGIDVTHLPFTEALPKGCFIAQDGKNGKALQNFKLVDWRDIEAILSSK